MGGRGPHDLEEPLFLVPDPVEEVLQEFLGIVGGVVEDLARQEAILGCQVAFDVDEGGDPIGVALGDILDGATGELAICEVWTLAKEAPLVITQGDQVYWDATNENVDKTNTNIPCGKAYASAVSAATTVQVLLNA